MLRDGRVIAAGGTAQALTAENVQRLYDVTADVHAHGPSGHLVVVPVARAPRG